MSMLKYGTVRLPPNYKAKLEKSMYDLERVNTTASLAMARADEYDVLADDQLSLNSLLYTTAESLNEHHELGLQLPSRPETRVSFVDKQKDNQVAAYSLLAVAHVMSISLTEYTRATSDARANTSAHTYDRPDPGDIHVKARGIAGHVDGITELFGSSDAQEVVEQHRPAESIDDTVKAIVATRRGKSVIR